MITLDLLDALRAHLAGVVLPDLSSVHLSTSRLDPRLIVQLACHEPSAIAGALLAWADTLDEVSAALWRVPGGESVHLSVIGRLPSGVAVEVYGSTPFTGQGLGGDLAPNGWATVCLASVQAWATSGEVSSR